MTITFLDGPKAGEIMEIPSGMRFLRVPLYCPASPIRERQLRIHEEIEIADYSFSGWARVDADGNVLAVVYQFECME